LPFVKEGLERGEKTLHFVDALSHAEHFRRLSAAGIDVAALRATGQLDVRSWQDTYLRGGSFDPDAMLAFLVEVLRAARAEGFPRTRLIGHAAWGVDSPVPAEALADYEMRVNHILPPHDPVVCVYDRAALDTTLAREILRAHPLAIVDGGLRESPSFRPPVVSLHERRAPGRATGVLRQRYVAALLAGDRREALDVVVEDGLWSNIPVASLYLEVIQPALYEIGRLWEQRRISVAQEHLATAISRLALSQLYPHLPGQPQNGKLAVVACVEGELHDLGAQMVADLLEIAGFDARFLGANVPTSSLVATVRERSPHLLALSATLAANVAALRHAVTAVRDAVGSHIVLAVGGQAIASVPHLPDELGADIGGRSAPDMVAAAQRLLKPRRSS
jgi:methanogenic corrinoid protein MtbC1